MACHCRAVPVLWSDAKKREENRTKSTMETNSGGNYTTDIPLAATLVQAGRAPAGKEGTGAGGGKINNDDNNSDDRDDGTQGISEGISEEWEEGANDGANNESTTST